KIGRGPASREIHRLVIAGRGSSPDHGFLPGTRDELHGSVDGRDEPGHDAALPHRLRSDREIVSFAAGVRRSGASRSPRAAGGGGGGAASFPAYWKPTMPQEATAYCRARSSMMRVVPA